MSLDIASLTNDITALIVPFLPILTELGKKAGEEAFKEVVKKSTDKGWDKIEAVWTKLRSHKNAETELIPTATQLAKEQMNVETQPNADTALRDAYQTIFISNLKSLLTQDESLANELASLMQDEQIQRVIARRDSEISGIEQSAKPGSKSTQEIIAEDHSRITNVKHNIR